MRALITGIAGQDGSYLAELLLGLGYEVHGLIRPHSSLKRIAHVASKLHLHVGDLGDKSSIDAAVSASAPHEVYHLAGQSSVGLSWQMPEHTAMAAGVATLRVLEAVRQHAPRARFYNAGTSEQFGFAAPPQNEQTLFHPRSPYACAKVFGYDLTRCYRESYGMFAVTGILGNHDSPRRGEEFFTRKVSLGLARIANREQRELRLGNLSVKRDFGHARDYVKAMHAMLVAAEPRDYVVGTGESHSMEDFARLAFEVAGLDWQKHVVLDRSLERPADVPHVRLDAGAIRRDLGWEPKVKFEELVREMVLFDLEAARDGRL